MNSNLSNTVSPQFNGKEENTRSKVWQQDTQLSQTDHAAVWAYSSTLLYKKNHFRKRTAIREWPCRSFKSPKTVQFVGPFIASY